MSLAENFIIYASLNELGSTDCMTTLSSLLISVPSISSSGNSIGLIPDFLSSFWWKALSISDKEASLISALSILWNSRDYSAELGGFSLTIGSITMFCLVSLGSEIFITIRITIFSQAKPQKTPVNNSITNVGFVGYGWFSG